jgi:hypothetical protein
VLAPLRRYILFASEEIQKDREKEKNRTKKRRKTARQVEKDNFYQPLCYINIFKDTSLTYFNAESEPNKETLRAKKRRQSLFMRARVIL